MGSEPLPTVEQGFISGTADRRTALGRMIPQPQVANGDGRRLRLDDALPDGFVALGLDTDPGRLMTTAQRWAGRDSTGFVTLRSRGRAPESDGDLVDYQQVLAPWLDRYPPRARGRRPRRSVAR